MDRDRRAGPDVVPDKTRIAFLDIGRAIAALLVVYTHIYNVFLSEFKHVTTWPTEAIDNTIVFPLRLDVQGIGGISVPLFFMISGFVVTPIAMRLGPRRFGVNRLFRVYPLLFFVVGVSAVLVAVRIMPLATKPQPVTVGNVISQATLYNFIDRPFGAWVGVAWTLAVEVLFYAMLVALLPLLRKRLWLAIAIELWLIAILLITHNAFGPEYGAIVINMVYTTIPIMGQCMWAAWHGKIPGWLAGIYVLVAWLLFVWAGYLKVDPDYVPRAFPVGLALGVFMIGLFAEPYLRQRRVWTALSERTYSIYLLHGAVAFPLMRVLFDELPLWLTVLIAVVATGVAAELTYRFVELPSHQLARHLSRRRRTAEERAEPEGPAEVDEPAEEEEPEFAAAGEIAGITGIGGVIEPDETPTERSERIVEPILEPEPVRIVAPRRRPPGGSTRRSLNGDLPAPRNGVSRRPRNEIKGRSLEGTTSGSLTDVPAGSPPEPDVFAEPVEPVGKLPDDRPTPPRNSLRPRNGAWFEPADSGNGNGNGDSGGRRHAAPAEPPNATAEGTPWPAARLNGSSGGKRRRRESWDDDDAPAANGSAPGTSTYAWPGETEDPDRRAETPRGGGRHRAKP